MRITESQTQQFQQYSQKGTHVVSEFAQNLISEIQISIDPYRPAPLNRTATQGGPDLPFTPPLKTY